MRAAQLRAQATVQPSALLIHTLTNLILIKLVVDIYVACIYNIYNSPQSKGMVADFTSLQIITFSLGHASKPGIIRTILHAIN